MDQYLKYTEDQLKLADIVLLIYDTTDENALGEIKDKWLLKIQKQCKMNKIFFVILANKIDEDKES